MDSWEGETEEPISLHKHLYGAANPVNLTDPSGYGPNLVELLVVTGLVLTLVGCSSGPVKNPDGTTESTTVYVTLVWEEMERQLSKGPNPYMNDGHILDKELIKTAALEAARIAYRDFNVILMNSDTNVSGRKVLVEPTYGSGDNRTGGTEAGYTLSLGGAPSSTVSHVYFPKLSHFLINLPGQENQIKELSPTLRALALGTAIGNVAAHEIGHQKGFGFTRHVGRRGTYDQPSSFVNEVFFEDSSLRWSEDSYKIMQQKLPLKAKQ